MRSLEFLGSEGDVLRLGHVTDAPDVPTEWQRLEGADAVEALRSAADGRVLEDHIASMWQQLRTAGGWAESRVDMIDALRWAAHELRRPTGILAMWRDARNRPAMTVAVPTEIESLSDLAGDEPPQQEHTWVAFRLLDLHGEPIPDIPYELTLGDGSAVQGATDGNGEARHEGIVQGGCVLAFPNLPERYWQRAHNAGD